MYIRVDFPTGRCYAAQAHDPTWPEWPPNSSRLFAALVASGYRSGNGITPQRRAVLEWLEALPPPMIAAPPADLRQAPVTYVPPGDSVGRKGKKGQEDYEHGVHRWRQPRYFPSAIILGDPVVFYGWETDPQDDFISTLDEMAAGVTHLGTSHSMAIMTARAGTMPQSPTLLPDPNGIDFFRVPTQGRLRELDAVFERSAGVRRPVPVSERLVSYRSVRDRPEQVHVPDTPLIVLRVTGSMHGADTAAYLGRALRRAVMSVLGDGAPSAVHGHNGGGHVGWLPLPDVGHPHANGRIIGIGIFLPSDLDSKQQQEILAGVGRVREFRLPDGRVTNLISPVPGEQLPVAMARRTWTRPCNTWATVTPVVLDRPPKRPTEERIRHAISQSLVFAGYPEPQDIDVSTFSLFQGAPPAFRVPADKPRYHATVRFKAPVAGPVIAGRLRYFGVGLFRPLPSSRSTGAQ